jgi:hypothetical protein
MIRSNTFLVLLVSFFWGICVLPVFGQTDQSQIPLFGFNASPLLLVENGGDGGARLPQVSDSRPIGILHGEDFRRHLFGGIYATSFGLAGVLAGVGALQPDEEEGFHTSDLVSGISTITVSAGALLIPGIGMFIEWARLRAAVEAMQIKETERFPFLLYGSIGLLAYGGYIFGLGGYLIAFGAVMMNDSSINPLLGDIGGGFTIFLGSIVVLASATWLVPGFVLLAEYKRLKDRLEFFVGMEHTDIYIYPNLDKGLTIQLTHRF